MTPLELTKLQTLTTKQIAQEDITQPPPPLHKIGGGGGGDEHAAAAAVAAIAGRIRDKIDSVL